MLQKEIFLKDKENCKTPFTHIEDNITNPKLKEIDEMYGAADVMSIENAKNYQHYLKLLALVGTLIAFFFLLYDEAELHLLIYICIALIFILAYAKKVAEDNKYHKKYVEYRVLAETLRVHYFLSIAGIEKYTSIILPWFIKKGSPWINEILLSLDTNIGEKKSILNCWIINQKEYHQAAWIKSTNNKEKNDKVGRIALWITLITYAIAAIFEFYMITSASGEINIDILGLILKTFQDWEIMVGYEQVDMIRAILKIVIGSMSAGTLFINSYYGKMSLSNEIESHRRMVMLYENAEREIMEHGESDELIISLAHEFLIENSTWYNYQSKNKIDITLE